MPPSSAWRQTMTVSDRCPHFQTRVERLPYELTTALLPIRRCLLAERMIVLIRPLPEAADVVHAFVQDTADEVPQCLCGPDLDAIEHSRCTRTRCESSCSPAYREMLESFAIKETSDQECEAQERAP